MLRAGGLNYSKVKDILFKKPVYESYAERVYALVANHIKPTKAFIRERDKSVDLPGMLSILFQLDRL